MVELSSRCLAFAEGVVTMVCPMLLTLSLKKDKEPVLPIHILAVAGATVVTGICPLLACCVSERFPTVCVRWPSVARRLAATISSACLLVLAFWIASRLLSVILVTVAGSVSGVCLLLGAFSYLTSSTATEQPLLPEINGDARVAKEKEAKELRSMVDKSHEFLSGVTGILFLGLGGLALEGLLNTRNGAGHALKLHTTISLFICALGVTLMFFQMISPRAAAEIRVMYVTDIIVAVGTAVLLVAIMVRIMGILGLLFLAFPAIIFCQLLYTVKTNAWRSAAHWQRRAHENGGKHPTAFPPGSIDGDNQAENGGKHPTASPPGSIDGDNQAENGGTQPTASPPGPSDGDNQAENGGTQPTASPPEPINGDNQGENGGTHPTASPPEPINGDNQGKNGETHPTTSPPEPINGDNQGENGGDRDGENQGEESKPAPMGLTKVTLTGFLAVSVKAISGGSPSECTVWFLLFAAAAIASGISWRLLTHTHNKSKVGGKAAVDEAANVASFCTHFCVAIATVLFAVMAWKAGSAKECAHVSQVTCVQLNNTLNVQSVKDMCSCIF